MRLNISVAHTIDETRAAVAVARTGQKRIGFVPTMGALHDGHASLIRQAAQECGFVVVSVFVNPLQFGPTEDLDTYPRTLEADTQLAQEAGADLVFAPVVSEMYPVRQVTFVDVEGLSETLCGASRPGHFRGVTTVVTKLFNIVQPDAAYFGQKDAQQAAVITRMVKDLCMPLEIVVCPTLREGDGLAKSSRNVYMNPAEREAATVVYRALQRAARAIQDGERDARVVQSIMTETIQTERLARIDYSAIVDADSLRPVNSIESKVLLALAVFVGSTRLIDNLLVEV